MPAPLLLALLCLPSSADEPCRSGPQAGERCGPYSFLVATGTFRGQPHCFVCDQADKPAVIVFARQPSDELGQFLVELDKALPAHKAAGLAAWVTFLSAGDPALEPRVAAWGRQLGLRAVPLGVFDDPDGPPSYRLTRAAAVTVLWVNKGKVVANHAFKEGELTGEKAKELLGAVTGLGK